MISRTNILSQLLFEFDGICRSNGMKYSLINSEGKSVLEEGGLPENTDYMAVAMTMGDLERFISIVNDGNSDREVEYLLNNPDARNLQYRYCNSNTTLINVKEIGNHKNYGMYLRIVPINDASVKGKKNKFLRFMRAAWKGSKKSIASCNYKRIVPVILLKIFVGIFGKKRIAKFIYNYYRKLKFIDKWEDIKDCKNVSVGRKRITPEEEWTIEDIKVDDEHFVMCSPDLAYMNNIIKLPSHETVLMNEIDNAEIPYSEIINSGIYDDILNTKKERDLYLKIVTLATAAGQYTARAWNIYQMTRDKVSLEEIYNDEFLQYINDCIEEGNQDQYYECMRAYLSARRKWKRKGIPFIEIERLEAVISSAKRNFGDLE